jgi:hypothetical protein
LSRHFASSGLGRHEALATAYARIYESLRVQAGNLAYIDTFMVLSVAAAVLAIHT